MKGNIIRLKETFGFISCEGESRDIYFDSRYLNNCKFEHLEEGDCVEFDLWNKADGRAVALDVRKLYSSPENHVYATPGIHPSVKLDHFMDDEKKIINTLSRTFYITNGGSIITINKGEYRYCLIKPTEYFCTNFHLYREIAVVFSDYVSFEPRSLDVASYIYQKIPSQLRLDRGCYLFICHDKDIKNSLSALLKDSNVNQIIIPFSYDEFVSDIITDAVIKERFKSYLFDTDLFSVLAPIKDDIFFFGRRDYVHDIVSKCKHCEHSGVFGLRRSGKTSLLYAVQNFLNSQSYKTVYIPCESELLDLGWREALYRIVIDIYKATDTDDSDVCLDDYIHGETTIFFEEDVNDCLKNFSSPITLMFDEIEHITFGVHQEEQFSQKWYDGTNFVYFWNTIKGYYSKYPNQICVLVAGTNPMINEVPTINNVPNPMYRQLSESNQGAYLQAFTIDDTENMVNTLGGYMGITFDEYSVAKLTSDCGGHPYLMRILCSHINKYVRSKGYERPITITKSIYDKTVEDFEKSSEAVSFFWMILNILITSYPKEYNTLKVLALEGDEIISKVQETEALFHLIGYGLVENNNDNYVIKYNTITDFLREKYKFERQCLSVEEQRQEISIRSNRAEIKLRNLVKNALLFMCGEKDAKNKVLKAMRGHAGISPAKVKKAETLVYDKLFDPSQNDMYFSLLEIIIEQNMNMFVNVFSGASDNEIEEHFKILNKSRRCPSHAFDSDVSNWSMDDFNNFRKSMSWLEDILAKF